MVVCKFFQQGYCRYAQNCRFEHVYGSKYTYNANPAPQNNTQSGVTDEQLLNQVHSDVNAALKGGQWILSCYAPFKEKPALPGLIDLSPEEARLFIYEAKANNTVDQAVTYMNNLFTEARAKYEQLLQKSTSVIKALRSLSGDSIRSPFSNIQNTFEKPSNSAASSIFRSAVQNTSVFGQNPSNASSVFTQKPATNSDGSMAKSIFAQASQNVFGSNQSSGPFGSAQGQNVFVSGQAASQNIFGSNQNSGSVFGSSNPDNAAAKSIFAQAAHYTFGSSQPTQNPSNVFANASQQIFGSNNQTSEQAPFAQNQNSSPFGQAQSSSVFAVASNNQNTPFSNNNNVFQTINTAKSVFGVSTTNVSNEANAEGIYSKMEDIPKDDLEAFESAEFKLGFVPEIAPPAKLCA